MTYLGETSKFHKQLFSVLIQFPRFNVLKRQRFPSALVSNHCTTMKVVLILLIICLNTTFTLAKEGCRTPLDPRLASDLFEKICKTPRIVKYAYNGVYCIDYHVPECDYSADFFETLDLCREKCGK